MNRCSKYHNLLPPKHNSQNKEYKDKLAEKISNDAGCPNTTGEDYSYYKLNRKETNDYYIISTIAMFGVLYAFYGTVWMLVPALGAIQVLKPLHIRNKAAKRRAYMREQFCDYLYSLSASISGGRHMFSSLKEAEENLKVIYPTDSPFITEIQGIIKLIEETHCKEEEPLKNFGERSGISDIKNFFEVYYICRDMGGDLVRVVNKSVEILTDKMTVQRDIEAYLAQKRFEAKIIGVLPVAIIYFLLFMSPEYMESLYGNTKGIIMMTVSIAALGVSYYWIGEMLKFENYSETKSSSGNKGAENCGKCDIFLHKAEEYKEKLMQKIPFIGDKIRKKQIRRDKEAIKAELPEFANQIVLLINAGMVITAAFEKIVKENRDKDSPMQKGLRDILSNMQAINSSFNIELRKFAVKTGVKEFIRLANIVNDNYTKGSELVWKLEGETSMMWHLNKKEAEEKGRVAESKMTFPMAIMLIVLVTITTAPAFMQL